VMMMTSKLLANKNKEEYPPGYSSLFIKVI